jgi:hypothetical protein
LQHPAPDLPEVEHQGGPRFCVTPIEVVGRVQCSPVRDKIDKIFGKGTERFRSPAS